VAEKIDAPSSRGHAAQVRRVYGGVDGLADAWRLTRVKELLDELLSSTRSLGVETWLPEPLFLLRRLHVVSPSPSSGPVVTLPVSLIADDLDTFGAYPTVAKPVAWGASRS